MITRKRMSTKTGVVSVVPTDEAWLNRPTPPQPTDAEIAASISVSKAKFSVQFRSVYVDQGEPLGAIADDVPSWISSVIAALPSGEGEAITDSQKIEALDRWTAASEIERANDLVGIIAVIAFGDQVALSDADPAVVLAELQRVSSLTDRLFIDAENLP